MEGKMAVVDCEALTVEKMAMVNTQAPTVEKKMVSTEAATIEKDMVNPAQTTKLRPTFLTLRCRISEPDSKIIPFLPKKMIEKSIEEPVKFGRTPNFDVFLNDECMSRDYVHIYADRNNPTLFGVINRSTSKTVIVDDTVLRHKEVCHLRDKSVIKLDIVTFDVSLRIGDENAREYAVSVVPEIQNNQQLSGSNLQPQNLPNYNLACCHASLNMPPVFPQVHYTSSFSHVCPPIHNPSYGTPICSPIHNSTNGMPVYPQIHNSANGIPAYPQINHPSNGTPVCSQNNHTSNGTPVYSQNHNHSNGMPVYPQVQIPSNGTPSVCLPNHSSSNGMPMSPQVYNIPNLQALSPQIQTSMDSKSAYPHTNKMQPSSWNGSSRREPQEHSMPSADNFLTEKMRQYQFIEDLNRKSSF